jgi:single-strand selective monofunctional uracil DNA glycosylase
MNCADALVLSAARLRDAVSALHFRAPVSHVYNPLEYAWSPHEMYLRKYGAGQKRVVFLGMNPGPYGMAQTGIPFGEVAAVRDWLGIKASVGKPPNEHPKRLIAGFGCRRSEPSGSAVPSTSIANVTRSVFCVIGKSLDIRQRIYQWEETSIAARPADS